LIKSTVKLDVINAVSTVAAGFVWRDCMSLLELINSRIFQTINEEKIETQKQHLSAQLHPKCITITNSLELEYAVNCFFKKAQSQIVSLFVTSINL